MSDALHICEVIVADGRISVALGERRIVGDTAAHFWRELAEAAGQGTMLLLGAGMVAEPQGIARSLARMSAEGLGAVTGRVRDADGALSPPLNRIEALRHLAVPPGGLLVETGALARAGALVEREPDGFWTYDLANALRSIGAVGVGGEVLASGGTALPFRLGPQRAGMAAAPGESLIVVYGLPHASVSLYFDGLPADLRRRMRFLPPGDLASDIGWLASAGLVVVARGFEHMLRSAALALLTELAIPYVWFTDDDLGRLADEERSMAFYRPEALKQFAAGAAAIVTTSDGLAEALAPLHRRVIRWPLVYDRALAEGRQIAMPAMRVGVFGGSFRRASLLAHVVPAVRQLGASLLAGGEIGRTIGGIETVPFEPSLARFVWDWQRRGVRALAHPYGASANVAVKGPASLLVAAYLGAVPVVGDEPAHAGLGEAQGVLVAGRDAADWASALRQISDAGRAAELAGRLDAWCRETFGAEKARAPFAELAALALPGGLAAGEARWQRAMQSHALRAALPPRTAFGRRMQRLGASLRRRLGGR